MKSLPIALQVYSIREEAAADFKGTMQKVKDMGYDGVELAGLYGFTPKEIRLILEEIGLIPISAHLSYDEMLADIEGTIENYLTIGCEYIAIPYLMEDQRPDSENFDIVMENIKKIGKSFQKRGLTLLYHNHDFEFKKIADGRYGLDYLYETISAEYLQTELDTCWVNVGGESPTEYIKKYAGRCPVVHLKDFIAGENQEFEFRALGEGIQDIPAILETCISSGTKWVVVEMDDHYKNTPMEDIRFSIDYLKKLGW